MIYIILFIICIYACWILIDYFPFNGMNFLKHILEANNLFCIQYLIFSCAFLMFEVFAVWKYLICIVVFDVVLIIALVLGKVKKKKQRHENISKEEGILLLITICFIVPFIYITTEDIAADTDQGAYFLHTCILMEEKSKDIHTLQELGKISDEVDEGIKTLLEGLPIYYHESGKDMFFVHALSSWCSYTALFGKMFGLWNCMKAVNFLYLLSIFNLFYVCKKNALNKINIYLYIFMFALSPLLLYIGKAGLSEVATLYFVTLGLKYIFEEEQFFSIIGGVCVGLIGYLHVSMYVYMPVITCISLLESVRKKKLAYFNVIQLLMFGFSIWYAYKISPIYVKKQYLRFTLNERISYFTIFILIDVIVIICFLIQVNIVKNQNKFVVELRRLVYENYRKISIVVLGIVFISTSYYSYFMCFTDKFAIKQGIDAGTWNLRSDYINKGIKAVSHLNLVNISRAVGIIGMLFFVAIPFLSYKLSDVAKTFYYISLYGMIVFTVLQMDTPSNYYCSRYFVPVLIPMIVLTLVCSLNKKIWSIYFIIVTLLYNHHFWPAFLMGGPKVGQYELLQDALEAIPENAIVFCEPESHVINARLSGNLRVLNNNEVYNLNNMNEVLDFYSSNSGYVISECELEINGDLLVYNIYLSQYSFGNGKNGTYDTGVGTYEIPLYIYKIENASL